MTSSAVRIGHGLNCLYEILLYSQKDDPTMYTNMEDIYFGYNEDRQLYFYIEALPEWFVYVLDEYFQLHSCIE